MTVRRGIADALTAAGLDPAEVERVIRRALDEDLAFGPDVTTHATVPFFSRATGDVVPGPPVCAPGCPWPRRNSTWSARPALDIVLRRGGWTPAEPDARCSPSTAPPERC